MELELARRWCTSSSSWLKRPTLRFMIRACVRGRKRTVLTAIVWAVG